MLATRILSDVRTAETVVSEWRELLARAPRGEPMLSPVWLLAWWRQFGAVDGRKLRLVTFRDQGRLVGLAPLSVRLALYRRALPVRRVELLATGEAEVDEICSDYLGVLADAGYEQAIAASLARVLTDGGALGLWDELLMPAMSAEDPVVEHLRGALDAAGAETTVEESGRCPYIPLPATWDDYLKKLESSSRYVVTRGLRELEKWAGKGNYALVRASTPEELTEGRRILHSLHGERWEDKGQHGVFSSARFARFHDDVMPKLLAGEDGTLDLLWLTVKGEPIACIYNIVFRGKVYFYQSGRKVDVPKQVKPGIAIHALALQRSIALGHREYDFLKGVSQYKMKLSLATRPLVTLRAVAPSLRARAVEAARRLAEEAIAKVRERRRASEAGRGAAPAEGDGG